LKYWSVWIRRLEQVNGFIAMQPAGVWVERFRGGVEKAKN